MDGGLNSVGLQTMRKRAKRLRVISTILMMEADAEDARVAFLWENRAMVCRIIADDIDRLCTELGTARRRIRQLENYGRELTAEDVGPNAGGTDEGP